MKRALAVVAVLILLAVVNGLAQPLQTHFTREELTEDAFAYGAETGDRPFVGVAFSGGGGRAAAFSAAGFIALTQAALPHDQITHISSVSGGGFTNAYLGLNPPSDCTGPDNAAGCDDYLAAMLKRVAPPSLAGIDARQVIFPGRILSPSRRLTSLTEELDHKRFLAGRTFADLPTDRAIFFNAVSYDTAKPFVFSNFALPTGADGSEQALPDALRSSSFSTAGEMRPTPGNMKVSLAVATSAAFPPYTGPTTIEDPESADFWHLGDGGIVENTGVATLIEALHASGQRSATIYSFDAGRRIDSEASMAAQDISIFSKQVTRIVDVLNVYSANYRKAAFAKLEAESGITITEHNFSYLDYADSVSGPDAPEKWREWSVENWPRCFPKGDTPAERLADIPTLYTITGCNRDLITTAAREQVEAYFAQK